MNVIIVQAGDILKSPPTINLINVLRTIGIQTVIITTKTEWNETDSLIHKEEIFYEYELSDSPLKKLANIPTIGNHFWNLINQYYTDSSIIWVVSNITLKYLGSKLLKYNYVLHFLELSESLTYYKKLPAIKLDANKLCNAALATVVPEYNRAHIMQVLWNINEQPFIFSNKPYISQSIEKNSQISDEYASNIINSLKNKKIILYQGILDSERPLDNFIYAVNELGNSYAFVVMSGGKNIYQDLNVSNYFFIPFVKPPEHLRITSHAFIGVLSYFPTEDTSYSKLNTLYCAPNKTFEYGMFGIPMIGNDIPGLRFLFETKRCGKCIPGFSVDEICNTIHEIETEYRVLSSGAKHYYDTTDSVQEVMNIINHCDVMKGKK